MAKRVESCRHIRANGIFCQSPALKGERFCYYHRASRERLKSQIRHKRNHSSLIDLPLLEDRGAIQIAIGEVLQAIAQDRIDTRRTGQILYGLQIATLNARDLDYEISEHDDYAEEYQGEDARDLEREEHEDHLREIEATEPEVAAEMRRTGCSQSMAQYKILNDPARTSPHSPEMPEKKPPVSAEHQAVIDDIHAKEKSFRRNLRLGAGKQ